MASSILEMNMWHETCVGGVSLGSTENREQVARPVGALNCRSSNRSDPVTIGGVCGVSGYIYRYGGGPDRIANIVPNYLENNIIFNIDNWHGLWYDTIVDSIKK